MLVPIGLHIMLYVVEHALGLGVADILLVEQLLDRVCDVPRIRVHRFVHNVVVTLFERFAKALELVPINLQDDVVVDI